MNNDFKICEYCLADNELRDEIRSRGSRIEQCSICHSQNGQALSASDRTVRRIFRALIRLNYSEWLYNKHIGGDSLESIIAEQKKIFNLPSNASLVDFEGAFLLLENNDWYPDNPEDISLGGGYWDGHILNGLREQMDLNIETVLDRGLKENHFALKPVVLKLIESIRTDIETEIPAGSKYSRARIGVKARMVETLERFPQKNKLYLPFSDADIDRPPVAKAAEGRLNRSGVSVLYLATNAATAVAELRPHPGHLVSIAEFVLTRPVRIVQFSSHDIRNFLSDNRLEDLRKILSFGALLNLPIQPEHRALHILTQLFSDCIRDAGYEGISFRSTLGPGINLACFADAFKLIPSSESVLEVRSLNYDLQPRNSLPQTYDREKYKSDGDNILSTLFDGLARNV